MIASKVKIIKKLIANDKTTRKYLMMTDDKHIIETGYYDLDEHIVCISSQVGCPMGCLFCASGRVKNKLLVRNLSSEEIVEQVKNVLSSIEQKRLREKRILFSFMGTGEPFLNYDNLIKSIQLLEKRFPSSRTTISTLGIRPTLVRKLTRLKFKNTLKLHLSLHAPNDQLRQKILPRVGNLYPILEALNYFSSLRGVIAKINYVLIKNLNDSDKQALQLAKLLKPYPFVVKLSQLNQINGLKPASKNRFKAFAKILNCQGIKTCKFTSSGTDIKAGCGQFKNHYYYQLAKERG